MTKNKRNKKRKKIKSTHALLVSKLKTAGTNINKQFDVIMWETIKGVYEDDYKSANHELKKVILTTLKKHKDILNEQEIKMLWRFYYTNALQL